MELKIVCEDEKYLPKYANINDACMDLKVKTPRTGKVLTPGSTMIFGTGIKVSIPDDYVMLIFPRSSTGMKLHCQFANGTGIIDPGYRDEIKVALHNFGDYSVQIEDAQRVAQFIVIPRPHLELKLVNDDKKFREGDRGGGLGSTGKM